MEPEIVLVHEFVEFIPEQLAERTLYISEKYGTAVHKCICGCGREVVTPLSPAAWQLTFDGTSVSLYPSIGSWSLPCKSHYLIINSKVVWAMQWTDEQIARGRAQEAKVRDAYYAKPKAPAALPSPAPPTEAQRTDSLWQRIKRWLLFWR